LPEIPLSTYRLQFNKNFTFKQAAAIVEYLKGLGISACYSSPYFKAVSGSPHGYDIVDYNKINDEIGNKKDYEKFVSRLSDNAMGQVLDIVPNHMAFSYDNKWLRSVLEYGRASPYSDFFDIFWTPLTDEQRKMGLHNKVLVPWLEAPLQEVIKRNKISVSFDRNGFVIHYYQNRLPVNLKGSAVMLRHVTSHMVQNHSAHKRALAELCNLVERLQNFLYQTNYDGTNSTVLKLYDHSRHYKNKLEELVNNYPAVASGIKSVLDLLNGNSDKETERITILQDILDSQFYKLSYWRDASTALNYRRFFDVNSLISVRVEDPKAFRETHKLIFKLLSEGKIMGLRIDHPDGLWNPNEYFDMVQKTYTENTKDKRQVLDTANRKINPPLYAIAEKILANDETIDPSWPIYGTTGYDFLNLLNGIFVERRNHRLIKNVYFEFLNRVTNFNETVYEKKKFIIKNYMRTELEMLGTLLYEISQDSRMTFKRNELILALQEVVACLPVYRTYISPLKMEPSKKERTYFEQAIHQAKKKSNVSLLAAIGLINSIFKTCLKSEKSNHTKDVFTHSKCLNFIMRLQQFTSPVMAKGLEDTAFYTYNCLISLNEVGGDPGFFGTALKNFHAKNRERNKKWPHTMIATSTHDTKRSEDVRARINVISEIPTAWRSKIRKWHRLGREFKTLIGGKAAPDLNDEYYFYQTLVGTCPWPLNSPKLLDKDYQRRICSHMRKAIREEKTNTTWTDPNEQYEIAVDHFVKSMLCDTEKNRFLKDFIDFFSASQIPYCGAINSLSQTVLKLTCPGIPDIYQGNEMLDFSLVDPDNRRRVDYKSRMDFLKIVKTEAGRKQNSDIVCNYCENLYDGMAKLYVTHLTLQYRQKERMLFMSGTYMPLKCEGDFKNNICAFLRQSNNRWCIVIVPRFLANIAKNKRSSKKVMKPNSIWEKTKILLPNFIGDTCFNLFTTDKISLGSNDSRYTTTKSSLNLSKVFEKFPVAVLSSHRVNR
jgi:(1->4)-alpha-D-glucan 1-alpha-D-glucosylmutase